MTGCWKISLWKNWRSSFQRQLPFCVNWKATNGSYWWHLARTDARSLRCCCPLSHVCLSKKSLQYCGVRHKPLCTSKESRLIAFKSSLSWHRLQSVVDDCLSSEAHHTQPQMSFFWLGCSGLWDSCDAGLRFDLMTCESKAIPSLSSEAADYRSSSHRNRVRHRLIWNGYCCLAVAIFVLASLDYF